MLLAGVTDGVDADKEKQGTLMYSEQQISKSLRAMHIFGECACPVFESEKAIRS